jgi:CRP-like cAMP-binding protein
MATSNASAIQRFIHRLLRRSHLSDEEQSAISNVRSHAAQVDIHRDIVRPGERVDHACLVVDGLVGRFDQLRDGRRQITALHIPGDMCDLQSVVAPVAGWGLEAVTTATILKIPHGDLRAIAVAYPAVAFAFWRDTAADASILAKWVTNVSRKSALARMAHLYCEMSVRMEQAGLGTRTEFPLPITQAQLGDVLGLTAVHVNRTLMSLRTNGVIRTEQQMIYVEDWDRLAEQGEFEVGFLLLAPADKEAA